MTRAARALRAPALLAALAASLGACGGGADSKEPTAPTAPTPTDPLSAIVDSVRTAWNMPAMGAAIVTLEDGVTAVAVAGTRRATGGPAVSTHDFWQLGSNTKAITSLLAAVAVSQDRIQWTTTIAQVFPELQNVRPEYRDMTLRELLSHQSGLLSMVAAVPAIVNAATAPAQRSAAVAWAVQQPPSVARGTFSYSNAGYLIAGAMLERVFGTSFESAVERHIYQPLGVTDFGWGPQAAAGSTTQPIAHAWQNGSWLVLDGFNSPPPWNFPAGGAHMSLTSWGRLMREVLRVEAGASTIVPAAVARQTTSPVIQLDSDVNYGMGWYISTRGWANGKILYHGGTNNANHSYALLAPERHVAFLVTINGFDPGGRTANATGALLSRMESFHSNGH